MKLWPNRNGPSNFFIFGADVEAQQLLRKPKTELDHVDLTPSTMIPCRHSALEGPDGIGSDGVMP